jgi:putative acetyltransferase
VNLRPATLADAPALGRLHILAMRTLTFLPQLHTVEEAVAWMAGEILPTQRIQVADVEDEVLGYVAVADRWIHQLYVHPDHQGEALGSALLTWALADARPRQLWTFQQNVRARRFYEARGFKAVEFTDGSGNEEKTPDVRYLWSPDEPGLHPPRSGGVIRP